MSTNFYWFPTEEEEIHIGKRYGAGSGRIAFMFQGLQDDIDTPIDSWVRWKNTLLHGGGEIRDEYGSAYALQEFIDMVESVTIGNRRKHFDWVQANKDKPEWDFYRFDDWLCPDGFSFTYREFS